ncbi:hypothetical protein ColLi_12246 [Colletotrichum liriopes]|uniref:Uncharacterized protein n=1 Tax=Colletotrichum liriopes TaxID=708192 RepID=A0AA37H0M8_9PEZI|nr:hypothetical protein ColLi_12246 [Colletotrichum liriopes]
MLEATRDGTARRGDEGRGWQGNKERERKKEGEAAVAAWLTGLAGVKSNVRRACYRISVDRAISPGN